MDRKCPSVTILYYSIPKVMMYDKAKRRISGGQNTIQRKMQLFSSTTVPMYTNENKLRLLFKHENLLMWPYTEADFSKEVLIKRKFLFWKL